MDEDVKFDEDATQKIDEMEVASERPALTQRPRLRMKKGKKVPAAAAAARLTTTPSSTTALDDTTVASEDLPVEHRFGQGIDLEMADIVRDDIDLSVKNAEINRQRSRSRNRVRNQNGIAGGGRRNSGGAGGGEKEEVIKLKWRRGSPPPTQPPPSESTEKHGRRRVKYREEYPVIVCDDPNDCPTPIYDDPPSVYEFGGKKKKKKATTKIIPPARNVKQASRGKRPMSGEGRRRFKPFQRKKASPGGTRRRNDTMQQQSVSGGGENGRLVVPQRMRVKDFAKDEFGGSGKEAALKSKLRKKTMRRKMRPVAQTTTAATTTEENGGGGEIEMGTRNRDRPMRPPFRRRRPTTSPFVVMDGAGEEDLQVAEETTTQHVPLDMVLMRDMSLPELQQFMANKVKEMNKKMKRVMKGHMEPKGDSSSASRPRMKVATPAPTALASTTSYPAVPELDLKRTTSRGKKPNDNGGGDGKAMPARLGDSGVLFRDQLRSR